MSVYIGWKQRVLVFSVKLSNANPVSTWIGERLTLLAVVDFSCIFYFYFLIFFGSCSVFVFNFFSHPLSLSNKYVGICSADAFSYSMTCLGYVFAVNGKII